MSLKSCLAVIAGLCIAASYATPTVSFPFNSQVPTVARVSHPYLFQFTGSTFAPAGIKYSYTLSGQPAWLSLNGDTRTFSGTPGDADAGSSTFLLTAADGTGAAHMQCTLVVSPDPVPQFQGTLSEQLAAETSQSSSDPATITLRPGDSFQFHFRQDSFIDAVQRTLYYYATLTDHTPLPAWLHFDADSLTFSGTTPQLSAFPQAWQVALMASDVQGFAGSSSAFSIIITRDQLVFSPQEQNVHITPGSQIQSPDLLSMLLKDGKPLEAVQIKSAQVSGAPAWLHFDAGALAISGTTPGDAAAQNVTVTVTDTDGDTASVTLRLAPGASSSDVFGGEIGTLTATAGEQFEYTIPASVISPSDADLTVILPTSAMWLHFDSQSRELSGLVPTQTTPSVVTATLTARVSGSSKPDSQIFRIDIKAVTDSTTILSGSAASKTSQTSSATSPPLLAAPSERKGYRGAIAGIIVGVVVAAILLLALLLLCLRRRREHGYKQHFSPEKRDISRPFVPPEPYGREEQGIAQSDVEKGARNDVHGLDGSKMPSHLPPRLALNLPRYSERTSKWKSRFSRISLASSLGNGEDAIRVAENIPEWGDDNAVVQRPHDSFSVPAEIARVSRQQSQQMSPSKRALRRLRAKRNLRESVDDIGLGIGMGDGSPVKRDRSWYGKERRRSTMLSPTMDRSSYGSFSTRGTSVLADTFPRPPTGSTLHRGRSKPSTSIPEEGSRRRSLWLVGRSDSRADGRSMQDKRQSFISKRKSGPSPLFAHGSRLSMVSKQTGSVTDIDILAGPSSARRSRKQLTSYSKSSSLGAPQQPSEQFRRVDQPKRTWSTTFAPEYPRAIDIHEEVDDTFAPKFPRVIDVHEEVEEEDTDWTSVSSSPSASRTNLHSIQSRMSSRLDLASQMALPRHKRSWVVPGEASPTPPPMAPPNSRYASSQKTSKTYSSSPLATGSSGTAAAKVAARRCKLSEPMEMVSNDSLSKSRPERPRLAHTSSGRPVSVEKVERLSSLRAERQLDLDDTVAGGDVWEEGSLRGKADGAGLGIGQGLRNECSGSVRAGTGRSGRSALSDRKFGKHIQKRQLDIPEYAASFVDYKALKKLIKKLSATPVLTANHKDTTGTSHLRETQAALQANKATFFFRLERELEKVNIFYLQKEAEVHLLFITIRADHSYLTIRLQLKLRLSTLLDKKRGLQSRATPASKLSSSYVTLDEGFRLFGNDLDKLQQFVEVNQTAFSKILKKWDKTSKSREKEIYLSRAVEVQPCFNRDVISELSDQATTGILELQAWAEGEKITYTPAVELENRARPEAQDDLEVEAQVVQAVNAGNVALVSEWATRTATHEEASDRISRAFLNTVNTATSSAQKVLFETGLVNFNFSDPINE
ncbi:phosphate system positive regulatory protein pho81, partial [Oleoguttula sp. CCFEE 5521]